MALAGCFGREVLKKSGRAFRSCKVFLMLPTPPCIHPAPAGPRLVEVVIQEYNCFQCRKTFHCILFQELPTAVEFLLSADTWTR